MVKVFGFFLHDGGQERPSEGAVGDQQDGLLMASSLFNVASSPGVLRQDFFEEVFGALPHLRDGFAAGGKVIVVVFKNWLPLDPSKFRTGLAVVLPKSPLADLFAEDKRRFWLEGVDNIGGFFGAAKVATIDTVDGFFGQSFPKEFSLFFAFSAELPVGVPLDNVFDVLCGLSVADDKKFHR